MKKSIRNLIIGAAMTAGVFAASTAAMAATYVQNDMNFRNGPAVTAQAIGSVPAGAQVEVLDSVNGWDLISFNGRTGYIHGGNVGSSYTAPAPKQQSSAAASTQAYYDNNWTQTAANMNSQIGAWKTVRVDSGYLALRRDCTFEQSNEIGQLKTGDQVEIQGSGNAGSYVFVYSPKYGCCGWVNAGFLV